MTEVKGDLLKDRPTFNAATYSMSHLKNEGVRTATIVVTVAITMAFLLLTSSLLVGVITDIEENSKQSLLAGNIPGSVDMFDQFEIDQDLSDRASNSLVNYLLITSLLVFIVAFFIMYNTMAISVRERRKEIGILRSVGYSSKDVMRLFLVEGAMIGFISWISAIFLGTPLIANLASYLIERGEEGIFFVYPRVSWQLAIASLFIALLLTMGSTYLATIGPIRSSPVIMLRDRI